MADRASGKKATGSTQKLGTLAHAGLLLEKLTHNCTQTGGRVKVIYLVLFCFFNLPSHLFWSVEIEITEINTGWTERVECEMVFWGWRVSDQICCEGSKERRPSPEGRRCLLTILHRLLHHLSIQVTETEEEVGILNLWNCSGLSVQLPVTPKHHRLKFYFSTQLVPYQIPSL